MECEQITKLKKRNKIQRSIIVCIIVALLLSGLILIHKTQIINMFSDQAGNIDYSLVWACFNAIGSILGFIGIIGTIVFTYKQSQKQNKDNFTTQIKMQKQKNFEDVINRQLEIIDPLQLSDSSEVLSEQTYDKISELINGYVFSINTYEHRLELYYQQRFYSKCTEIRIYIEKLKTFNTKMNEYIFRINSLISEVSKLKIKRIEREIKQAEGEPINLLENKIFYDEKEKTVYDLNIKYNYIKNEIRQYRRENWMDIVNSAKLVIEERERIIVNEIE